MKQSRIIFGIGITCLVVALYSCGGSRKLSSIERNNLSAQLVLPEQDLLPEFEYHAARRDTIRVKDVYGNEMILMKAIKDDSTGDMVANEVLDAAVVTARFRNIAERRGKVDLQFQVIVPKDMQDGAWQLRFYPDMFIMEDSTRLEPVIITGKEYRKAQMRGYEQYERFLSKIVSDPERFVDIRQLEVFLERNIPQVYAYKADTSYVSDLEFYSFYGVSERQAVEHFTNKYAKQRNERRIANKGKMFQKYVKSPLVFEGIRLDTVIQDINGDFVYNYTQTINTRPKLRKVDIVLSGDIWDQDRKIYSVPATEPLSFYISSLSSFTDVTEHYLSRVIERRAEANVSYKIVFGLGKADIEPALADNEMQIGFVKENLVDLLQNEVYDLDSIVVVANASPEGSWNHNDLLSKRRGESVVRYFEDFVKDYRRRLQNEGGFEVDENGNTVAVSRKIPKIKFISHSVPENWKLLDQFVKESSRLDEEQKSRYFSYASLADMDAREARMKGDDYYPYLKDSIYTRLRVVDFSFALHRKGMLKDTLHTTELDEKYMEAVQLLKDMDYEAALKILGPYQDYNTAVAYMACERNASAMLILSRLERTPQVNYLLAILYSRTGKESEAVQCYLDACREDQSYVYRGNLDPEISALIKLYGLNKDDEDEFTY